MVYEPGVRKARVSKAPRDLSNYGAAVSWRFSTPGLSPSAWGVAQDFNAWKQVLDGYFDDRLEAAHAVSTTLGIGPAAEFMLFLEILELEYETGLRSSIMTLGHGLECEYVEGELSLSEDFFRKIEAEILEVRRIFQVGSDQRHLVCVLATGQELINPVYRDGYYVRKAPYGKTCLPARVAENPELMTAQLRRAQAGGLAYEQSEANADRWFVQALTCLVDPKQNLVPGDWRTPDELEACFFLEEETDIEAIRDARLQAQTIGRHLLEVGGKDQLLGCLREHSGGLGGRTTTDCVQRVYGLTLEDVFHDLRKVGLAG